MFRLLRVTLAARPADLLSDHNRRSEANDRWRLLAEANMKKGPAGARPCSKCDAVRYWQTFTDCCPRKLP
jgi:hypothetical protein